VKSTESAVLALTQRKRSLQAIVGISLVERGLLGRGLFRGPIGRGRSLDPGRTHVLRGWTG